MNLDLIDRYRGALLGLAVGDALGTTLEFRPPGSFEPVNDMVGGGPFQLEPGQWTDDTSMALCLAESLLERRGFDPVDQLSRYVRWWEEGHLSSAGECFDIGNTVRAALMRFKETGDAYCGSTDLRSAGNGSLMRLAPVPLAWFRDPETAIRYANESSRTTHGAQEAVDACRFYAGLIVGALRGEAKATLLAPCYHPVHGRWPEGSLSARIETVAAGSYLTKNPPEIRGTGYVVASLEAALWAFHRSDSFPEGALKAVNLGNDADTTGAIYGQLAGAFYGVRGIPTRWLDKLARHELIDEHAERLRALADALGGSVASEPGR